MAPPLLCGSNCPEQFFYTKKKEEKRLVCVNVLHMCHSDWQKLTFFESFVFRVYEIWSASYISLLSRYKGHMFIYKRYYFKRLKSTCTLDRNFLKRQVCHFNTLIYRVWRDIRFVNKYIDFVRVKKNETFFIAYSYLPQKIFLYDWPKNISFVPKYSQCRPTNKNMYF